MRFQKKHMLLVLAKRSQILHAQEEASDQSGSVLYKMPVYCMFVVYGESCISQQFVFWLMQWPFLCWLCHFKNKIHSPHSSLLATIVSHVLNNNFLMKLDTIKTLLLNVTQHFNLCMTTILILGRSCEAMFRVCVNSLNLQITERKKLIFQQTLCCFWRRLVILDLETLLSKPEDVRMGSFISLSQFTLGLELGLWFFLCFL